MNKKKIFTLSNGITFVFILGFIYLQFPSFMRNLKQEGITLPAKSYPVIGKGSGEIEFPPKKGAVVIFWASWCGPCKVEMARLQSSVENGKIPGDKIFAINAFESKLETEKFLSQNPYPFVFLDAPEVSNKLQVDRTPTTLLMEDGKIISMSSGMSLFGIWRAENLF